MLEGVLKGARGINAARIVHVSILGMLEGVLKAYPHHAGLRSLSVSILGMLEGVLKAWLMSMPSFRPNCFNPWYVGGGVKRATDLYPAPSLYLVSILGMLEGVLKAGRDVCQQRDDLVSILGMLEGVLKAIAVVGEWKSRESFNPWYVGGGVKSRSGAGRKK